MSTTRTVGTRTAERSNHWWFSFSNDDGIFAGAFVARGETPAQAHAAAMAAGVHFHGRIRAQQLSSRWETPGGADVYRMETVSDCRDLMGADKVNDDGSLA